MASRSVPSLAALIICAACGASGHSTASIDTTTSTTVATSVTTPARSDSNSTPGAVPPASVNGIVVEPPPELTPGASDPIVTQANIDSTICASGYTASVRPPVSYTNAVKAERLRAYGYDAGAVSFELDHLIPLELGGSPRAVANLWPEPWESKGGRLVPAGWGAETKDQFENYLHRAVCAHRLLLADAQRQMAEHWIVAANNAGIAAGPTSPSTPQTASPQVTPPSAAGDGEPAAASARCRDGSYSFSQHRNGTCSGHGGVAQWINEPRS